MLEIDPPVSKTLEIQDRRENKEGPKIPIDIVCLLPASSTIASGLSITITTDRLLIACRLKLSTADRAQIRVDDLVLLHLRPLTGRRFLICP